MYKHVNLFYSFDCIQPASKSWLKIVVNGSDLAVLELRRENLKNPC